MLLKDVIQQPAIAADLQKFYGGDVSKVEQAAKSGDVRAQQLKNKIANAINTKAPLTASDNVVKMFGQTGTKTTTPQNLPTMQERASLPSVTNTNTRTGTTNFSNAQTPQTNEAVRFGVQSGNMAGMQSGNITGTQNNTQVDFSNLEQARLAAGESRDAYTNKEKGFIGFEDALREAIMKKAEYFQSYYNQMGDIKSELRTVDTDTRKKYGEDLKEDPFALRQVREQTRGALEGRLTRVEGLLKEKKGYLDDIIDSAVKAQEASIKASKLDYDTKKEKYDELYDRTKLMVDYLDKNYEGEGVQAYKDAFLKELGYENVNQPGGANLDSIAKVVNIKDGIKGGQCGAFVNDLTGLGVGDSYQSKLDKMDKTIKTPQPGMVFVMKTNSNNSVDTGHIGVVLSVNKEKGTATVKDSNWNGDQKVMTHEIPISKMTGFIPLNVISTNLRAQGSTNTGYNAITPKATTQTTTELKTEILNSIRAAKTEGQTRKQIESMIWNQNIDPTTAPYKNFLDTQFGEKAPADLQTVAYNIVTQIKGGNSKYVMEDGTIKLDAIPAAYRERVKTLLSINK